MGWPKWSRKRRVPASGSPSSEKAPWWRARWWKGHNSDQIRGDGGAAVFPVDDVVGVQPEALGAEGVGAALVAAGEVAAGGPVGGAFGGVDADDLAEPVGDDLDGGVTGQVAGDRVGHHRSQFELAGAQGAVGVEVVVDHHGVAFAALAGAPVGGIEGVGGFGGHAHQPVGPGDPAGPLGQGEGVGVAGLVVVEVVAVAELGVTPRRHPQAEHRALIRWQAELAPQPAVVAVAQAQHPLRHGCRGPVAAVGLFGQGPQQPVELGDQQGGRQRRDLGVAGRRDPAGDAHHRVLAQPPGGEQRPTGGQLRHPAGDGHQALGPGTGHAGLPAQPVLGRLDAHAFPAVGVEQHPHRGHQPGHRHIHRAHHRHRLALGEPPRHLLRPRPRRRRGGKLDHGHAPDPNDGVRQFTGASRMQRDASAEARTPAARPLSSGVVSAALECHRARR